MIFIGLRKSFVFIFIESNTRVRQNSLSRTSTLANLMDGSYDPMLSGVFQSPGQSNMFEQLQFKSTLEGFIHLDLPQLLGLSPDLDGVFQSLRSTVDNFEIILEHPISWDDIPNNSSSPNNLPQLPPENPKSTVDNVENSLEHPSNWNDIPNNSSSSKNRFCLPPILGYSSTGSQISSLVTPSDRKDYPSSQPTQDSPESPIQLKR